MKHNNTFESFKETSDLLKILSNINRLRILCRIFDEELAVSEIEEELSIRQPTLSRELNNLREKNIISPRKVSKVVFYSFDHKVARNIVAQLCDLKLIQIGPTNTLKEKNHVQA